MQALAIVLFSLLACSGETPPELASEGAEVTAPTQKKTMTEVDVQMLHTLLEDQKVPVLVDVRQPDEWAGGHVPQAVHIPLGDIQERVGELESHKGDTVYVICARGGRSARAGTWLSSQGYTVVNVAGGTLGWQAAGFSIE